MILSSAYVRNESLPLGVLPALRLRPHGARVPPTLLRLAGPPATIPTSQVCGSVATSYEEQQLCFIFISVSLPAWHWPSPNSIIQSPYS